MKSAGYNFCTVQVYELFRLADGWNFVDEEKIEQLVAAVKEQLQSDEDNLEVAVDVAVDFSKQNSIAPETLLNYSALFISNGTYAPAYVFAKAAANLSEGNMKASACCNAGISSSHMRRNEEAEEQYKIALSLNPNHVDIHSNYGLFLKEIGRKEEAEEHYKIVLSLDPNNVIIHSSYGLLLNKMERKEEAEEHYKMALSLDSNNASAHYNYGLLLKETGRKEEAEEHYKLSLSLDSNHADIHSDYGLLLSETGRKEEAEEHYKIALSLDPNDFYAHSNYGLLLSETRRYEKAEGHYRKALALDPNAADIHHNYGLLLSQMRRNDEAEKQYQITLNLNPNHANAHGAYGLFLFAMGKEKKARAEIKTASQLFGETGNNVIEHLLLAWLYQRYAERYYRKGNARKDKTNKSGGHFRKSGVCAGLVGDEYIKAGKHVDDKIKGLFLSQGYMLKGRSEVRRLELSFQDKIGLRMRNLRRDDYDIAKYELIMDGVKDAAGYYKEAAKHSPERNPQCDTCSNCMSALSDMLDYMLSIIYQRGVPDLNKKIKDWNELLASVEMVQQKSEKGEKFIEALRKFIPCIDNLEKYKNTTRHEYKKALKDCMSELEDVASNIEGPLQEIIENSAQQMKKCMLKHKLYTSETETESKNDGVISKIANKVWDKICDKIATAIVTIIVLIISLFWFGII